MIQAILVEFIGTLFFLYTILVTGNFLPIGLSLMLAIVLGGGISGGNFNPAVTIMMVYAKKQDSATLIPYMIAQVLGGISAVALSKQMR